MQTRSTSYALAFDASSFIIHALSGVYVYVLCVHRLYRTKVSCGVPLMLNCFSRWELGRTLPVDWSICRRKRGCIWGAVLYFACRYAGLLSICVYLAFIDTSTFKQYDFLDYTWQGCGTLSIAFATNVLCTRVVSTCHNFPVLVLVTVAQLGLGGLVMRCNCRPLSTCWSLSNGSLARVGLVNVGDSWDNSNIPMIIASYVTALLATYFILVLGANITKALRSDETVARSLWRWVGYLSSSSAIYFFIASSVWVVCLIYGFTGGKGNVSALITSFFAFVALSSCAGRVRVEPRSGVKGTNETDIAMDTFSESFGGIPTPPRRIYAGTSSFASQRSGASSPHIRIETV
ncbi:hypothetical protein JAAARDRAFT_306255 [Jaapia argillacea MUCL 33604]|uniref:Transmembrane protein n=1 Tax=Jaapia argillacea MUCL 33604 TaxID=933084 RepID=A0A067PY91_9AGAM|nr:hypothetical protein JAAARDRAFT_306255 [Jaapia argillacea MUCL 33604]